MAVLTLIAAVCGLVEGLLSVLGSIFIFLCVDYPEILIRDQPTLNHFWRHTSEILNPKPDTAAQEKIDLKPVTILAAGYSNDPSREIIFCFSILCGVFSLIWIISSILIIPGTKLKSPRFLWSWVLTTLACAFLDFVAAIFFAAKTGGHVNSFKDSENSLLSDSTLHFMKYNYPLILLIVFSRGIVTVPINLLLAIVIHRKAEDLNTTQNKQYSIHHSILAHSPTFMSPEKNGALDAGPSNGLSSSAVYTNQSYTHDEKF